MKGKERISIKKNGGKGEREKKEKIYHGSMIKMGLWHDSVVKYVFTKKHSTKQMFLSTLNYSIFHIFNVVRIFSSS